MNTITVQVRHDKKRLCGYRKPGGLYFITEAVSLPCGRLPVPCDVCPTCHGGIKPSRGFTWVDAGELLTNRSCAATSDQCSGCPPITGKQGLVWVGEAFYPDPNVWLEEAQRLGVSRRIPAVPKDFKIGENWVLVGHRKAMPATPACNEAAGFLGEPCLRKRDHDGDCDLSVEMMPAIFHIFKPSAIEYVVRGDESAEDIEKLHDRGITAVRVYVNDVPVEEMLGNDDDE